VRTGDAGALPAQVDAFVSAHGRVVEAVDAFIASR